MKILVADDEKLARDRLIRLLKRLDDCHVVGVAEDGLEAVQQTQALEPDVILLDIRMPGMDGLEAAHCIAQMNSPPAVIFCTAFDQHAVKAFDVQAMGYLLKPVRSEDLAATLASACRINRAQLNALAEQELGSKCRTHISARTRRGIELVPIDEVRYFQADQKYVTVRWPGGELLVNDTLRQLEAEFGKRFIRIHRNALVAVQFIEKLQRDTRGHYQMRLRGVDNRLDVSRRHVAALHQFLESL